MSWATPAEATSYTGETIEQSDLDRANAVLDIFVGVTEDALDNLKPRDVRLLKKAEAFQAAWLMAQVDYTGRSDITLADGDGLSFSKGDQDTHVLAPLAKRAIKKLSWNQSRTLNPLTPKQAHLLRGRATAETIGDVHPGETGSFLDSDDYLGDWRPI